MGRALRADGRRRRGPPSPRRRPGSTRRARRCPALPRAGGRSARRAASPPARSRVATSSSARRPSSCLAKVIGATLQLADRGGSRSPRNEGVTRIVTFRAPAANRRCLRSRHVRHRPHLRPDRGRRPSPSTWRSTSAAGLPSFTIVGLPDAAVRESRERVRSALVNSGFQAIRSTGSPPTSRRPTCARPGRASTWRSPPRCWWPPASSRAACSIDTSLAGELALDGAIRPVPGALAMAEAAAEWGMRGVAVAPGDAAQAALVERTRGGAGRPRHPAARARGGARSSRCRRAEPPTPPETRSARPRRPARPSRAPALPRDRRGRRPQPAADRAARRGEDARRAAAALAAAPAEPEGGDRGDPDRGRLRRERRPSARTGRFGLRTTRSPDGRWSAAGRRPARAR